MPPDCQCAFPGAYACGACSTLYPDAKEARVHGAAMSASSDEAGEAWRIQQCRALQQYVRKQLTHSWAKSGRCDVVACQNVTECFLPYRNGSDHDSEGYHSDSYGAQKSDLGEICSVPLKADQFAPRTIVVCSPQCYDRAKTLKHSAPTLFGLFGPILRGTACQRTFPLHHE